MRRLQITNWKFKRMVNYRLPILHALKQQPELITDSSPLRNMKSRLAQSVKYSLSINSNQIHMKRMKNCLTARKFAIEHCTSPNPEIENFLCEYIRTKRKSRWHLIGKRYQLVK